MSTETRGNADLMNRPMRKMRLSPGRPQPPRPLITRAFDRRDERAPGWSGPARESEHLFMANPD